MTNKYSADERKIPKRTVLRGYGHRAGVARSVEDALKIIGGGGNV